MADEQKPPEEHVEQKRRENHFLIDTEKETFTVIIYLDKDPATSLGTLEMAKDAIKNVYVQKAMRDSQKGIIRPPGTNGHNGGLRVH